MEENHEKIDIFRLSIHLQITRYLQMSQRDSDLVYTQENNM